MFDTDIRNATSSGTEMLLLRVHMEAFVHSQLQSCCGYTLWSTLWFINNLCGNNLHHKLAWC